MKRKRSSALVYSTASGRHCPGCQRPLPECVCRDHSRTPRSGDGTVRISRQTKGRKGAGVTLIEGLPLAETDLRNLAKRLKTRCGVGGSVKEGIIELQGDQREVVRHLLEQDGHRVKLAGG